MLEILLTTFFGVAAVVRIIWQQIQNIQTRLEQQEEQIRASISELAVHQVQLEELTAENIDRRDENRISNRRYIAVVQHINSVEEQLNELIIEEF